MKCLIVEDDKLQRLGLRGLLKGHEIDEAANFEDAKSLINSNYYDIAFFDLDLGNKELAGLDLTKIAKRRGLYCIITTGHTETEIIRRAYELGCQDYLAKPISQKALDVVLRRYTAFDSEARVDELIAKHYITNDKRTLNELNIIKKISLTDKPILIKGPSGTGKRVVAHIIRETLRLPKEKFVEINCAQFSESLIESEIFGHKKGAFTGATEDKKGLLAQANGGVIFFDEIHSLTKNAQQKLMKAIEEKEFYPVGSSGPVKSDFRIICATCENLLDLIGEKKFRPDFYARISSMQLELFPLKERKDDILPLIQFQSNKFLRKLSLTPEAEAELLNLEWKNNTRDIESLVEYWHIHGFGIITPKEIPDQYRFQGTLRNLGQLSKKEMKHIQEKGLSRYLDDLKLQIIRSFVDANNGSLTDAAKLLGVSRQLVGKVINQEAVRVNLSRDEYEERIQ